MPPQGGGMESDMGKNKKISVKQNPQTLAMLGLCTAAAMILSYVESFIPSVTPGLKIGLPNVVIVFVLYRAGWPSAAAVSLVRVVLTAILFGSVMSLAYGLAGAVLSLIVMTLLRRLHFFSVVGVSVAGGVAHNAAQILVAAAVMQTTQIVYYLPVLIIGGTIAGILIGIAGGVLLSRFPESISAKRR